MANSIRCIIFFLALSLILTPVAFLESDKTNYYVEKYYVDPEIKTILDSHSSEIEQALESMRSPRKKYRDGVWQFSWLPGYFIKYDISRIEGMRRIKDCIKKNDLNLITVPDKRLYHIGGRPESFTNRNYVVVVKKAVPATNPQPLTLKHAQQLSTIIKKTTYVDLTGTNYVRLDNGALCIIDTEGSFDSNRLIRGYLRLLGSTHDLNTDYTPEALMFIFNEIKNLLKDDSTIAPFTFMRLEQYFAKQQRPLKWNFVSYCNELLSDYRPARHEIDEARLKAFNR